MSAVTAVRLGAGTNRLKAFVETRRHDTPGVLAVAAIAILEAVSSQFFIASDAVNQYGLSAITDGQYRLQLDVGLAGIFLPFVIAAWLFGKHRAIRVMFRIAIAVALFDVVTWVVMALGTINTHTGNLGAATLLANAGALWVMNVAVFALWYWSTDGGGPDVRGTSAAKRPDFDFPQQRHEIRGWEGWLPAFHDYLYAAFVISLTFHPAGTEVLSARAKFINMVQALTSVAILLILVAKGIATFAPGP